ncbi:hypothetical protein R9C00_09400 [Flammeovirgaceae bacterium SG7u.111]|nr:hypothetical protein [Flammeovirgaceae bacterium SG7u.132]WPO37664.1 hypothetical protein R9C00_09400 [Flammeovirgaceae bacterium SG7u.111]
MRYLFYCFYRIIKGNNDSTPYFTTYAAISAVNYMNFFTIVLIIERILGSDIMPKNLNKLGIVISALPVLILNYYLFFYKKRYLEIINDYEKSNKINHPNWVAIGSMVVSFLLLAVTKKILFYF